MNNKSKYKVGDIINLDCGYRGPDYQDCKIVAAKEGKNVWGRKVINLTVRMDNGEQFVTDRDIE